MRAVSGRFGPIFAVIGGNAARMRDISIATAALIMPTRLLGRLRPEGVSVELPVEKPLIRPCNGDSRNACACMCVDSERSDGRNTVSSNHRVSKV